MSDVTAPALDTASKVRGLTIEPHRRAVAGGRGFGPAGLVVGLLLGIAATVGFQRWSERPLDVETAVARLETITPAEAAAPAGAPTSAPLPPPSAGSAAEAVLTASGYVTPHTRVSLSPRVMGHVAWVGIEKGDRVGAGQVLVRLVDDEYRARVDESAARVAAAEARLAELTRGARPEEIAAARAEVASAEATLVNAEAVLARREELVVTSRIESRQALDDARAARDVAAARLDAARQALLLLEAGTRAEQLDAARADLEAARAALRWSQTQLEDTVIRAPMDGTILEKLIEVGELVSPQSFGGDRGVRTELLSLADLARLQVELDVNESDFARVQLGQAARVTLDAYPTRRYDGRVREIAPEANRQKATVQIKVDVLAPDAFMKPEMGARVDLLNVLAAGGGGAPDAVTPAAEPGPSRTAPPSPGSEAVPATPPGGVLSFRRVVIPSACVARRGTDTLVFLVRDGRAREQRVTLDAASPGAPAAGAALAWVEKGLDGGEVLVVRPPEGLRDLQPVRPRP